MKKIIRLTESDLVKLVKRVIKEQNDDDWYKFDTSHLINQQVRWYRDEANTQEYSTDIILKLAMLPNKVVLESRYKKYSFNCGNNFVLDMTPTVYIGNTPPPNTKLYNKKYIPELQKSFCTTNSGGKSVINIGRYSQTNQNTPMNIA
jgi:hypothetical protein